MSKDPADLGEASVRRRLFTGGTVWAGAACTRLAGWVLVEDDRIAAVGEASERGAALPSPVDERLDLSGCHLLPGFVDVHLHLSQAAWFLLGVDGLDWASMADCLHAVQVHAAADPGAPWLLFWRVARWRWPEGRLPTAAQPEEAAPDFAANALAWAPQIRQAGVVRGAYGDAATSSIHERDIVRHRAADTGPRRAHLRPMGGRPRHRLPELTRTLANPWSAR